MRGMKLKLNRYEFISCQRPEKLDIGSVGILVLEGKNNSMKYIRVSKLKTGINFFSVVGNGIFKINYD